MELKELEKSYTAAIPGTYRWYVGVYSEYLDKNYGTITDLDKPLIFSFFKKLRDEHTLNWSRNTLYEFREDSYADVNRTVLRVIRSTNKFDVLKVCLYVLRNMRKNRILDNYILLRLPELGAYIEGYSTPETKGDLQEKVSKLSRSEQSLRPLETLFISNKFFDNIAGMREVKVNTGKYHTIDMNSIEILVTEDCNLKCYSCDKMCSKAESSDYMTVEQIRKFIDESLSCNKMWTRIAISGGEPTTHPDILEIVGMLLDYRNRFLPITSFIQVVSNGYEQSSEVIQNINRTFKQVVRPSMASNSLILNNSKRNKVVLHSPINGAPVDNPAFSGSEYRNGCWVPELSGLGLTRYGYYCCGTASAIDRVFGYDIGVKSLTDVTMQNMVRQRIRLCSLCGRYNDLSENPNKYSRSWVVEEFISPTWDKAFESYRKEKPVLTIY